jgi:hypothetical protein
MRFKPASERSIGSLRRWLCPLLCNKIRHEKHHRVQRKLPSQALSLSRFGRSDFVLTLHRAGGADRRRRALTRHFCISLIEPLRTLVHAKPTAAIVGVIARGWSRLRLRCRCSSKFGCPNLIINMWSFIQNVIQQSLANFKFAVVINEAQVPKLVHEQIHARPRRSD